MLLVDTSGLLAALDSAADQGDACRAVLAGRPGPLLLSPFVLAELDYLVSTRVSTQAAISLLGEVSSGAYRLERMDAVDVSRAREVVLRHEDLAPGLTDASIVVLAERYGTSDVLTLDQRHFRVLQPRHGPFRLLPADA